MAFVRFFVISDFVLPSDFDIRISDLRIAALFLGQAELHFGATQYRGD